MGPSLLIAALLTTALADEPCPNPRHIVMQTEREIANFYLQDAEAALGRALDALACAGLPEPDLLARLRLAEGVLRVLQQEDGDLAFQAAARVDPDVWNADYGPDLRATYEAAAAAAPEGQGEIALRGLGADEAVAVDGQPAELPLKLPPGLYLLQVGVLPEVRLVRTVRVEAGETLMVRVQEGAASADTADARPVLLPPRDGPVLTVGGAVGLATTHYGLPGQALELRFVPVGEAHAAVRVVHGRAPGRSGELLQWLVEVAAAQGRPGDAVGIGWSTLDTRIELGWSHGVRRQAAGPRATGALVFEHESWPGATDTLAEMGVVVDSTRASRLGLVAGGGLRVGAGPGGWLDLEGSLQWAVPVAAGGGGLATERRDEVLVAGGETLRPRDLVGGMQRFTGRATWLRAPLLSSAELGVTRLGPSRADGLEGASGPGVGLHGAFLAGVSW